MPRTHLEKALHALENRDRAAALTSLIDAWRECRTAKLEEVIDVVSRDAARSLTPLDDSDKTAYDLAWTDLEAKGRAIDVEHLLPGLWERPKGSIGLRFLALHKRGPDPRVGAGLMRMISKPPMTARTSWSTWSGIFDVLPSYVDNRARRALKKRAKTHDGDSKFWPKLTRWIEVVVPKLPKPATLSDRDQGLLARAQLLAAEPPQLMTDAPPPTRPREIDVDDALGAAADHLDAGELALALKALRTFWAARRSSAVAKVFDRLVALVDKDHPTLEAGTKKALHARWMQLAAAPSAAEVGQLLEVLDTGALKQTKARFGAMKSWAPDPRVAYSVLSLIENVDSAAKLSWSIVAEVLSVHADLRLKEKLTSWKQLTSRDDLMTAFEVAAVVNRGAEARRSRREGGC